MDKYIKIPFVMTVSGANGSGKTHFVKYAIKTTAKFDCILVISQTASFNNSYDYIHQYTRKPVIIEPANFKEAILLSMNIQKKNVANGCTYNMLMIFDDIAGLLKDSAEIRTLMTMHRHYNISIMFCIQYINMAATYLREVSKYDIVFQLKTKNSLLSAYENYFINSFDSFNAFKDFITKALERYKFLFVDKIEGKNYIMKCPMDV